MLKKVIIAIDGPAGSGKSTAAKNIAQNLDFIYLDTGAMYRAITYLALRNGIVENIPAVIELTQKISLKVKFENNVTRVFVDGEEVTDNIRTPDVNSKVSEISTIPEVRSELVKIQKKLGEEADIVAEGRDVTTVVFPYADVKIFMTASVEERAKRRFKEFQEKKADITLEEVKENIEKRDKIDSERSISPLKKADDAIEFDNTGLSINDELDLLLNIVKVSQLKKT
jgi:cytidylate kinase